MQLPPDGEGKAISTVVVDDKHQQVVTLADDTGALVAPLTNAELRATAVPVIVDLDGTTVTGPLTDDELRATAVPVTVSDGSGPVTVDGTVTATGPVTNFELRATPVPVSGPLTDALLRATPVPVSGAVTISDGSGPVTVDGTVAVSGTVPVSGSVGVSGTVATTGPVTDGQLRAASVPVLDKTALVPVAYDYMSLTYTGADLTGVVYKTGGSGGTTVATLTLAYTAGVLQTVTRT